MARTVKGAGQDSWGARRGTTHGSKGERRALGLAGRMQNNDKKPNGFLSRHSTPASGRQRGGPWG